MGRKGGAGVGLVGPTTHRVWSRHTTGVWGRGGRVRRVLGRFRPCSKRCLPLSSSWPVAGPDRRGSQAGTCFRRNRTRGDGDPATGGRIHQCTLPVRCGTVLPGRFVAGREGVVDRATARTYWPVGRGPRSVLPPSARRGRRSGGCGVAVGTGCSRGFTYTMFITGHPPCATDGPCSAEGTVPGLVRGDHGQKGSGESSCGRLRR